MTRKNLFFVASLFGVVLLAIKITGFIGVVIEFRAMAMIVFAMLIAMTGQRPGQLFSAIREGITGSASQDDPDELVASLKQFENCLLICGLIFIMYSTINLLGNLAIPAEIGPNLSLALNCSIYAIGMAKLCVMPLRFRLINSRAVQCQNVEGELLSGFLLLGFPFVNFVIITIVLYSVS